MRERLVGGEGFAIDATLVKADASRQRGVPGADGAGIVVDVEASKDLVCTAACHGLTVYRASFHIHLDTGSVERAGHGLRVQLAPSRIPMEVLLPGGFRDTENLVQ